MKATDDIYDVVIVGAGPVGLTLGIGLARKNLKLLVLEKAKAIAENSRAPAIWPGTQEVFAKLGIVDGFLRTGTVIPEVKLWDADSNNVIITMPIQELRGRTLYPQLLILPQPDTEKLLLDSLAIYPTATVLFSSEVIDLYQKDGTVSVTYINDGKKLNVTTRILVGADGAHSFVRGFIGASLEGKTYPLTAALADVKFRSEIDHRLFRITTRKGIAIAIPMCKDTWRIIIPRALRNTAEPIEERVRMAVKTLFGLDDYDNVWMSDFQIHNRLSTSFSHGRIVLAGDAAHLNSPVGGQGMNAGIQDTVPLSEAIEQALARNDMMPIRSFAEIRREEIRSGVNSFTDKLTQLLLVFADGRMIKPVFRGLSLMMRIRPIRQRVLKQMAMIK